MSPPDGAASDDTPRRPLRAPGQRVEDYLEALQEIERSIARVRNGLKEACAADGPGCASMQDAVAIGSKPESFLPLTRSSATQEHGGLSPLVAVSHNIPNSNVLSVFQSERSASFSLPPPHLGRVKVPAGPACDHAVLRSIVGFKDGAPKRLSTTTVVSGSPTGSAHAGASKETSGSDSVAMGSSQARHMGRRPSTGSCHHFDIGLVRQGRIARKISCLMPVIHPEARFIFIWLMLGWACIVYESFSAPLFWAFDVLIDGHMFVIASLINAYFIVDIAMMFFTAYHDESGVLVLQLGKIARRYRKGWLCFDLVAAVPWEWMMSSTSAYTQTTKSVRVLRVIRLLRCIRALRVTKMTSFTNRIEAYEWAGSHDRLMRYFALVQHIGGIVIMVHWIACVWYYVGVHAADNGKSWVNHMLVEEGGNFDPHHDALSRYWFSVYFVLATVTTVGFGDITPTTLSEVLFTSVLLLLSCPCLGYLTGRVVEVTMSFYAQSRAMREKRSILQRYLSWRHVPHRLGAGMRQHLMHVWNATGGNDEVEALVKKDLSPMLHLELMYHIHGRDLDSMPFLVWMRGYSVVVKEMAMSVEPINLSKGDFLFHSGEHNETVYLLRMGNVWISQNRSVFAEDQIDNRPQRALKAKAQAQVNEAQRARLLMFNSVRMWQSKENRHHASRSLAGDPFYSSVLHEAGLKIQREDLKLASAARMLQRSWRQRLAARRAEYTEALSNASPMPVLGGANDGRSRASSRKQPLLAQTIPSGEVLAPAYFGESCLWVDRTDWALPGPRYKYSASCRTRAEVLSISRDAVRDVIDKFSPWLGERFEIFRAAVVAGQEDLDETVPPVPPDAMEGDADPNGSKDRSDPSLVQSPIPVESFPASGSQETFLWNDEGPVRKTSSRQVGAAYSGQSV